MSERTQEQGGAMPGTADTYDELSDSMDAIEAFGEAGGDCEAFCEERYGEGTHDWGECLNICDPLPEAALAAAPDQEGA